MQQFLPGSYLCRPSQGICDVPEYCTGLNDFCPQDTFQPKTYQCHTATGSCDTNTTCTGYGAYCPTLVLPPTSVCRIAQGPCDTEEMCDGVNPSCPADAFKSSTVVCQQSQGVCMRTQYCPGNGPLCLIDSYLSNKTVCRDSKNVCDLSENCTGISPDCPPDGHVVNGAHCEFDGLDCTVDECNDAGNCVTVSETCNCVSDNDCVVDVYCLTSTCLDHVCQVSQLNAGYCYVDGACYENGVDNPFNPCEYCDVSVNATGWSFMPANTSCTTYSPDGPCSARDTCNGAGLCVDNYLVGHVCHTPIASCDVADYCVYGNDFCPNDNYAPNTTICHSSTGICDVTLNCTNTSPFCPMGVYAPSTTLCHVSAGFCDPPEYCTGGSPVCPADVLLPAGSICHAAEGICDQTIVCNGTSPLCPPIQRQPLGYVCHPSADFCDQPQVCDGVTVTCPPDTPEPNTTLCRLPAQACELATYCDGVNTTCPPLTPLAPSDQVCHVPVGGCDSLQFCTGSSPLCPADNFLPNGTFCQQPMGICGLPSFCDGFSPFCPVGGYAPNTVLCRHAHGVCDLPTYCTGANVHCPRTAYRPNNYTCAESNFCTGLYLCTNGTCLQQAPANCTIADQCYDSYCDNITQECVHSRLFDIGLPCYTGPINTIDVGTCHTGIITCSPNNGSLTCTNETLPLPWDLCGSGEDNNCDGVVGGGCVTEVACIMYEDCTAHAPTPCQRGEDYFCDEYDECVYPVASDYCLIDGRCYTNGTLKFHNPCQKCLVNANQFKWTIDNSVNISDNNVCNGVEQCAGGNVIVSPGPLVCNPYHQVLSCARIQCNPLSGCETVPFANGTACHNTSVPCDTENNEFRQCKNGRCVCDTSEAIVTSLQTGVFIGVFVVFVAGVALVVVVIMMWLYYPTLVQGRVQTRIGKSVGVSSQQPLSTSTRHFPFSTTTTHR